MVDVRNYYIKYLTDKIVKPEESFINSYVYECLESNSAISSTRSIRRILDVKYEKADLNNFMAKQCQHPTAKERYRILHIVKKFEDLFGGTLGIWNTTPVYL